MIIIADSGSTKTHLKIVNSNRQMEDVYISGINPFYQTEEEIHYNIESRLIGKLDNMSVSKIYFYGAGCAFPEKKQVVNQALSEFFPHADIHIHNDLLAAARALFADKEGLVCILGTGSNSCHYQNGKIIKNVSPLGFILGDEGSGAVLGKKLVANCMKNIYSADLVADFYKSCQTTPAEIMEWVYKRTFPNRYLASLVPYIVENIDRQEMQDLVESSFQEFFQRNVTRYQISTTIPLGFIGSIAYQFQDILKSVATQYGMTVSKIEKEPMQGLVKYHIEHINNA